jgi:hypothetical protein
LSEEIKPRKRYLDYKVGKIFGDKELRIVARKERLKIREPLDPETRELEMEIADLEFQLKKAEGRIKSGLVPELIPRDKELVEELRKKISVLKGQLNQKGR